MGTRRERGLLGGGEREGGALRRPPLLSTSDKPWHSPWAVAGRVSSSVHIRLTEP